MSTKFPTESVTGQNGWEWNQLQSQQESRETPTAPSDDRTDERPKAGRQRARRDPSETRRRTIDELQAQLQRRERRLQLVIDRYERLLAEKNRRLATLSRTESPADGDGGLLSTVRRYLDD